MRRFLLIQLTLSFLTVTAAFAADLEVEVTGLASDEGDVHIALYDTPEQFPEPEGMIAETHVPIDQERAVMTFKALKPGRYAVAVYHDANANHSFDQIIFGLPIEDYGFSNDARVFFAPPSFAEAAFDVVEPITKITIRLNH